jgi:hypothetical protein
MSTAVDQERLASLEARLEAISHQLDFVVSSLRDQELRQGMWDELRRDLAPVTGELMERVSRELDDVRSFIEPPDLLRAGKRLLRDLPYLEALLDQVESLSALGGEISPLSREILVAAMARLADLEQRGYFAFARASLQIIDALVTSLGAEQLQAVRDGIPAAVAALTELSRPEALAVLGEAAAALSRTPAKGKGLFGLLWALRRPRARLGLARALAILEALGSAGPPVAAT